MMKPTQVRGDDGLSYMPPVRDDELLYSFIARCQHHRSLSSGAINRLLFDRENSFTTPTPNRITRLTRGIRQAGLTPERIVWEHTLFPYMTAFDDPAARAKAMSAVLGGGVKGPSVGGVASKFMNKPGRAYRFCRDCRRSMLADLGELYWRRTHQLPLSTMCPQHERPLHVSTVIIGTRGQGYIRATEENTPDAAPTMVDGLTMPNEALLLEWSIEGDRLLHDHDLTRDRRGMVDEVMRTLGDKGYVSVGGQIVWPMLQATIDHQLADIGKIYPHVLERREGFSIPAWLIQLRYGGIRPAPELVMMAERIARAAPEIPPTFGPGPWLCVNPIAKHRNRKLIKRVSRRTVYGDGYRGLFECSCGYSYTMRSYADGSVGPPRFSRFGPLLADAIADARARGRSLWQTATALRMEVVVLLNAMEKEGVPIHWPSLPEAYRTRAAIRATKAAKLSDPAPEKCEPEIGVAQPS